MMYGFVGRRVEFWDCGEVGLGVCRREIACDGKKAEP